MAISGVVMAPSISIVRKTASVGGKARSGVDEAEPVDDDAEEDGDDHGRLEEADERIAHRHPPGRELADPRHEDEEDEQHLAEVDHGELEDVLPRRTRRRRSRNPSCRLQSRSAVRACRSSGSRAWARRRARSSSASTHAANMNATSTRCRPSRATPAKARNSAAGQGDVDDELLHPRDGGLGQEAGTPEEGAEEDEQEDWQDFGECGERSIRRAFRTL